MKQLNLVGISKTLSEGCGWVRIVNLNNIKII